MADKPHRAIILFGDGLLIDNANAEDRHGSDADASTTLSAARCPALHDIAKHGASGFLALRRLAPSVSEEDRIALELGQLWDLPDAFKVAASGGERMAGNNTAEGPACENDAPLLSLSERFMNLAGALFTSSRSAASLGQRAGFEVFPLQGPTSERQLSSSQGFVDTRQSPSAPSSAGLPNTQQFAHHLISLVGLDKPEDRLAPPPSAAQRSEDEFELAFVHITKDDFAASPPADLGPGCTSDTNTPHGSSPTPRPSLDPRPDSTSSSQPSATPSPTADLTLNASWTAAVKGIEWLSSLVGQLRQLAVPDSRAESHMFLIVLLGYGQEGLRQSQSQHSGDALAPPGVSALLPVEGSVPRHLAAVRPRQSFRVKEDNDVMDVREHHPILAIYHLDSVVRRDDAKVCGVEECKQRGGNLAILADRFLHEVTFKLWRSPKYGA